MPQGVYHLPAELLVGLEGSSGGGWVQLVLDFIHSFSLEATYCCSHLL